MALDMTTFAAALKQHYTDWRIENLVYKNRPLFAMISKYEEFGGDVLKMPIIIGNPQNRSATFSQANSTDTSSLLRAFLLTRVRNYSLATIDNETMLASEGDSNAFLRAATVEINGALDSLARDVSIGLYGSGRGDIGRLSASTTLNTTTVTLASAEDIVRFEVGMVIVASGTNSGTITLRNNSGTVNELTIVGVDRIAGTITFNAAPDSFATGDWQVSDYLYVKGDVVSGGTSSLKLSGLQAWLPFSKSGLATSFFNVDRSVDATRLSGVSYDGSALPIEEALISGISLIGREGGKPDYCFMSFTDYANLVKALGSKVQYTQVKAGSDGALGFQGVMINGPRGTVTVIPDQDCPVGYCFPLQMDTWKMASLKKAVNLFDGDGLQMLRAPNSDALQIRCFSYAQVGCNAPGWNGQIKLS